MIHEEICTYEVCKLAKEKGFDVPTHYAYNENRQKAMYMELCLNRNAKDSHSISAPTQSLLQRWLREEKEVFVEVYTRPHFATTQTKTFYVWNIQYYDCKQAYRIFQAPQDTFYTYEEALEDALKYAFKNLV